MGDSNAEDLAMPVVSASSMKDEEARDPAEYPRMCLSHLLPGKGCPAQNVNRARLRDPGVEAH